MRSYTIGNTHSNHMLPLYKRSSLSKYRYNLSNNPSPFWLSNKDQYNSLYLEAVYRQGWVEAGSNKHRYHWETVYVIVGYGPYNTPIYGNPQVQVRDSFSQNHYNAHVYRVEGTSDVNKYGPLQYKHSATDIDTLHYCFILNDLHITTSGHLIPTYNPYMFSVPDSYFSNISTSLPQWRMNNGKIEIHVSGPWGPYGSTVYEWMSTGYTSYDAWRNNYVREQQRNVLIGLLNGDRGNKQGNFIYYQWKWDKVFDHYNYHYEMGALYQDINKLPLSTLNNTSSGVTFSIYA